MRFAMTSDGERVRATARTPSRERGDYKCPNPHCGADVYIKCNFDAPNREEDERENESRGIMPHFAHYEAPDGVGGIFSEIYTLAKTEFVDYLQNLLELPEEQVDVWLEDENDSEKTLFCDLVYRDDIYTYVIFVVDQELNIDEYDRRFHVCFEKGYIPIYVFHANEGHDLNEEYQPGGFYKPKSRNVRAVRKQVARRNARMQGYVLSYFVLLYDDQRFQFSQYYLEKTYHKKTEYWIQTRSEKPYLIPPAYHITRSTVLHIFLEIALRYTKLWNLMRSDAYDPLVQYTFVPARRTWEPRSFVIENTQNKEVMLMIRDHNYNYREFFNDHPCADRRDFDDYVQTIQDYNLRRRYKKIWKRAETARFID